MHTENLSANRLTEYGLLGNRISQNKTTQNKKVLAAKSARESEAYMAEKMVVKTPVTHPQENDLYLMFLRGKQQYHLATFTNGWQYKDVMELTKTADSDFIAVDTDNHLVAYGDENVFAVAGSVEESNWKMACRRMLSHYGYELVVE